MKKVKALQYLVYIVFGLLILQNIAGDFYRGFKEGYEDGSYAARNGNAQRGPLVSVVLNGDLLTHQPDSGLRISPDYTLQNTTINTHIRLSKAADTKPFWVTGIDIILVFGIATILVLIAITINRIIKKIGDGNMFDEQCVQLIRKTASLLLVYALTDYVYQRFTYFENSRLIHAPLQVVNTSAFSFEALISAILVFIIAEAFKQGNRLKQEQDLTI
jgi:hypothetical protein